MARFTKKLLALAIVIMIIMTMAIVPTTASGDYLNAERILGSFTTYTRDQFVTDFEAATNKSVLNFEEGNYTEVSNQISLNLNYGIGTLKGGAIPITNRPSYLNVLWRNYQDTKANFPVDSTLGALPSWSGAKGADMIFCVSDTASFDANISNSSTELIRPTSVGFIISSNAYASPTDIVVSVTYTDGTTTDESQQIVSKVLPKETGNNGYFVGIKAPTGKFIKKITTNMYAGGFIDDVCVILTDPADFDANKTKKVEISGEAAIEQPAYNAIAKYTYTAVAKDESENELEPLIQWKLDGDYYGDDVSIDENGVLTVTRDFDTTKTIKLIAYVHNELTGEDIKSDPLEITVSAVEPYLRSDRWLGDVTSYSRAEFIEDFENAQHKAVLNFEDGTFSQAAAHYYVGTESYTSNLYGSSIQGYNVPITDSDNTELNVYWKGQSAPNASSVMSSAREGYAISGTKAINVWGNQGSRFVFGYEDKAGANKEFISSSLTSLRPTSVGFMYSCANDTACGLFGIYVKYTDGTSADLAAENTEIIEWPEGVTGNNENKGYFIGYKAPAGKFIQHVEFASGSGVSYVDDICVILEDPAEAELALATDALGYTEISALSDIGTSTNITASMPKNGVANSKLILAIYGDKGLIDVDIVDANPASGTVTAEVSRGSETVKSVKAFIWDSMTGLVPLDGAKFILK